MPKCLLHTDSIMCVPKSKQGVFIDTDPWLRSNIYVELVSNKEKYGKTFSGGMLQEVEQRLIHEQPDCTIIISMGNDFFPGNGFMYSQAMKDVMRNAIRRIVEGNNILVVCHGHMLVLKKSWLKVKWTLFYQKQLEDLEAGWELVVLPLLGEL